MRHVILRQIIEIFTDNATEVFTLQQRISDLCHDEILPTISKAFDEGSDEHVTLYVDQLVIDLGTIREDDLNHPSSIEILMLSIGKQIAEQLKYGVLRKTSSGAVVSITAHAFDHWIFYMEHGYMKWNVVAIDDAWHQRILEAASGDQKSIDALRRLIRTDVRARRRIVFQHSWEFLTHILEALTANGQSALSGLIEALAIASNLTEHQGGVGVNYSEGVRHNWIWEEILLMTASDPGNEWTTERIILTYIRRRFGPVRIQKFVSGLSDRADAQLDDLVPRVQAIIPFVRKFKDLLQHDSERAGLGEKPKEAELIGSANAVTQVEERSEIMVRSDEILPALTGVTMDEDVLVRTLNEDGLFARHAGLVILHPFITPFFNEVGLAVNGKFMDDSSVHKAMLFLQYLALGDQAFSEYEMVIAKLLCGFPLKEPYDATLRLTDADRIAAEELLRDVIAQWTILQNTTSAGLREGFLQRPGKYYVKNERHYLHVENSSIDMLLDRLPWGLSLIKLPWMKHVLNVEWR